MRFDPLAGLAHYVDWAVELYHPGVAAAGLALALAVVAAVALLARRLAPGSGAVLAVLCVSLLGAAIHPNQKPRFLNSWLPVLWMLAGAGAGIALAALPAALGRWRHALAAAAVAGLAWWQSAALLRVWAPPAWAGPPAGSDLDIARLYLDRVPADGPVGLIATIGGQAFLTWTWLARFPEPRRLDLFRLFEARDRARVQDDMARWIAATPAATLVVLTAADARYDIPEMGLVNADLARILGAVLAGQDRFRESEAHTAPGSAVTATIWTRRAP